MANTKLADATPGTIVKINENGNPTEFYIAAQNYENELNDTGLVLLARKNVYDQRQWNSTNLNTYDNSAIDVFLNDTYKLLLEEHVRLQIANANLPYTIGGGNTTLTTLKRAVFLLSATEYGLTGTNVNVEGTQLPISSHLNIAHANGGVVQQWTRSPYLSTSAAVTLSGTSGTVSSSNSINSHWCRPAFCLVSAEWEIAEDDTLVEASSGGDTMFIPAAKLEQGVEYNFRVFPRNWQNQFQTGIDGSSLHMVVQDGQTAEPDDSIPADVMPSYTGNSQIFGDGQKGYIEMYDSGVLTLNRDTMVDIFLVGGGGGGGNLGEHNGGSGGGGGYTQMNANVLLKRNTEIPVTIGSGGAAGVDGGDTSVDTYTVSGGKSGKIATGTKGAAGGDGGSGGGGAGIYSTGPGGNGGVNGGNGVDAPTRNSGGTTYTGGYGGVGQGASTYEFFNTQLRLFSSGGGGGGGSNGSSESGGTSPGGTGGSSTAGNGGRGGMYRSTQPTRGTDATDNTGSGGGGCGGASQYGNTKVAGGKGGSGIAIIRWGDWNAASANTTTEEVN